MTGLAKSTLSQSFTSRIQNFWNQAWAQFEESTGEVELARLKESVQQASNKFDKAVEAVSKLRAEVAHRQKTHEDAHSQYTQLLLRRDQWNGTSDPAAFVELTAKEVETRQLLVKSRELLRSHEKEASICQQDYMNIMRQRYHEEQIWQDKWRMWGTYGTWSLIVLNSFVFIGSQLFHQRREYLRLKAMEEMITSKLQSLQRKMTQLAVSSKETETIEPKKEILKEREVDENIVVVDEADAPSRDQETHLKDKDMLKSSEDCKLEAAKIESPKYRWKILKRLEALKQNDTAIKFRTLTKDVHGPSVALGAASMAGVIFISILIGRN